MLISMGRTGWLAIVSCGLITPPLLAQPHGFAFGNAAKFFSSAEVARPAGASFAIEIAPRATKPIPPDFGMVPAFSVENGTTTARIVLPEGTSLYGLGSAPGPLLRNGAVVNDAATPWVLAVAPDGKSAGVFADTTYSCRVSLDGAISISSPDPGLAVVILKGDTPAEVLRGFNEITGRMEMPARWILGYHHAAGKSETEARATVKWLRDSGTPADAIWVGGQNGVIGWDADRFPDATKLVTDAHDSGLRIVAGAPTTIPQKPGESTFDSGSGAEAWVLLDSGAPATRNVGSLEWVTPDFTREATRTWWSGALEGWSKSGAAGFWLPPRQLIALPAESRLRGDPVLGGPGKPDQYEAVISTLLARATFAGAGGERVDRRAFVAAAEPSLTLQRSAAVALQAETPTWESLRALMTAVMSTSLSGQPLVGAEIPDFDASDPELARRWSALASMFPMTVGRFSASNSNPMLSQTFKATHTAALQRKYRLLPYYYTLCFNAFFLCEPMIRPLYFADLTDVSLRDKDDAFLLGPDLLVVPRLAPGAADPTCPLKGNWRRLDLGVGETPDMPVLYLRPGAILPLGPVLRDSGEKPTDPITLVINPDANGNAEGAVYEDDGDGFAFYKSQCRRIGYAATREGDSVFVRLSKLDGASQIPKRRLEVRLLTDAGEIQAAGSEKGTVKVDLSPASRREKPQNP